MQACIHVFMSIRVLWHLRIKTLQHSFLRYYCFLIPQPFAVLRKTNVCLDVVVRRIFFFYGGIT
jgi:hypothetical protein